MHRSPKIGWQVSLATQFEFTLKRRPQKNQLEVVGDRKRPLRQLIIP